MASETAYPRLLTSDTTLRDGAQMAGAHLTLENKLRLARAIASAGVNSMETGFPAAGSFEIESVRAVAEEVKGILSIALCRALPADIDAAAVALRGINPFRRAVNLFVATSPLHRRLKLKKTEDQVLTMIQESVSYALRNFRIVCFSPEDASRTEPEFLCDVYRTAIAAGATTVSYPDTVGILTPEKVKTALRYLRDHVLELKHVPMAAHFHNDLGLAVANTLAAVQEGVNIVQCTVNGLGERAGNASLEEVALALSLHADQYAVCHSIKTEKLFALSQLAAELSGIPVSPNKAVSGSNIFITEAGIHQDGLLKDPMTYLPYAPELVGAAGVRLAIGKHSGRNAVRSRLRELGYSPSEEVIENVMAQIDSAAFWNSLDDARLLRSAVDRATAQCEPR